MAVLGEDEGRSGLREALRLRRALLTQLGVATPLLLAACGVGDVGESEEEGGVTTNPSSASGEASSEAEAEEEGEEGEVESGPGETGTMQTESEGEAESGPVFDLGLPPDSPAVVCTDQWVDREMVEVTHPQCELEPPSEFLDSDLVEICVPAPNGCDAVCGGGELCEGMEDCLWSSPIIQSCGPYEEGASCCMLLEVELPPPVGRPLIVAGENRLADVAAQALDARARHWLDMARGEHASIAAFARFIACLQACGAPASLVAESIRAAADEVRHTQLALDIAGAAAGRPLGLGALAVEGVLDPAPGDLEAALRAAVLEGCIGETLAAHEAACLAARVEDPKLAYALAQIAEDELRHAALAWRFVRWALARAPELRGQVEALVTDHEQPLPPVSAIRHDAGLAHGCPSNSQRARWRATARAQLVLPCLMAL